MTIPTSLKLEDDLKKRVQKLADTRRRSSHWMMIEAIRQYIEREEKREAFRDDAIQAWHKYQENGLHATSDEVTEWLETWGEDDEKSVPACHK